MSPGMQEPGEACPAEQAPRPSPSKILNHSPTSYDVSSQDARSMQKTVPKRPALGARAHSAPLVTGNRLHASGRQDSATGSVKQWKQNDEERARESLQPQGFTPLSPAIESVEPICSSPDKGHMHSNHSPPSSTNVRPAQSQPMPPPQSLTTNMQDINICVLGSQAAGKTTFIQRALGLPKLTSSVVGNDIAVDGNLYAVKLFELSFDAVRIGCDDQLTWPRRIEGVELPMVDAVVIICDTMRQESLAQVRQALNGVRRASLPCALVTCQFDHQSAHKTANAEAIEEKVRDILDGIPVFQASGTSSDVQKQCLSEILRAVVSSRSDSETLQKDSASRRRANSSAVQYPSYQVVNRHERASSEFSGSQLMSMMPAAYEDENEHRFPGNIRLHLHKRNESTRTFLDFEDCADYDSPISERPSTADDNESTISDLPSDEKGYTFDQLVDRLLAQPLSKNDSKFVAIFLALYRRFATPGQLLEAITQRFEAVQEDTNPRMIRAIVQLRHLAILEQWIRFYPGDFAYQTTRRNMRRFVSGLASERIFSVAAREMLHDLDFVVEDDDTDWACCDKNREPEDLSNSFTTALDERGEDLDAVKILDGTLFDDNQRSSRPETMISSNSLLPPAHSSQNMLGNVDYAQRQAKLLVPIPRTQCSKIHWHLLMNESEENIAKELTRIDWVMFSSIRPRDLIRHVSLSNEDKKKCKSLDNVNRMIDHFNHLAYVVSNYILFREKPKHRALMLEKWMKIARKVRELNNYNSLGAILAGINGTAVHRLVATRELVNPSVAKDFMKLEILMGSQKSHFAYRLAWENSSGERIPYLPLHRRDLVSTNEGNSTFISDRKSANLPMAHPGVSVFTGGAGTRDSREAPPGGIVGRERINWKKFEIMGEVIVGVQKAQGTPYPTFPRNDEIRKLILDIAIQKDDEELYERSVHLEAGATKGTGGLNWFKR